MLYILVFSVFIKGNISTLCEYSRSGCQLFIRSKHWLWLWFVAVLAGQGCSHDGELLPDDTNCRKYFKCSNGKPATQSCPGTLIFDPLLKICNWPDTTTCIQELKPKVFLTFVETWSHNISCRNQLGLNSSKKMKRELLQRSTGMMFHHCFILKRETSVVWEIGIAG